MVIFLYCNAEFLSITIYQPLPFLAISSASDWRSNKEFIEHVTQTQWNVIFLQNEIKTNNSPARNTFQRVGLLDFRSWELMEDPLYISKKRICSIKCYPVHRWEVIFSKLSHKPSTSEVRMRLGEFPTFGREAGNNLRAGDPKSCCRMELHTFAHGELWPNRGAPCRHSSKKSFPGLFSYFCEVQQSQPPDY